MQSWRRNRYRLSNDGFFLSPIVARHIGNLDRKFPRFFRREQNTGGGEVSSELYTRNGLNSVFSMNDSLPRPDWPGRVPGDFLLDQCPFYGRRRSFKFYIKSSRINQIVWSGTCTCQWIYSRSKRLYLLLIPDVFIRPHFVFKNN